MNEHEPDIIILCPECETEIQVPATASNSAEFVCALGHIFTAGELRHDCDNWS